MLTRKKIYLAIYAASVALFLPAAGLGAALLFGAIEFGDATAIDASRRIGIYSVGQFVFVHAIFNYLVLERMWRAIQDGQTTITVKQAIGFLFIPLFNIYWIFRTWASFPTEFNRYVERYDLPVPPLARNFFVAYPVLILLAAVLYVPVFAVPFVFLAVAYRACGAVDELDEAKCARRAEMLAEIRTTKIIR